MRVLRAELPDTRCRRGATPPRPAEPRRRAPLRPRRPAAETAARAARDRPRRACRCAVRAGARRDPASARSLRRIAATRPDAPRAMPASRTNSVARTSSVVRKSPTPTARAITARCWNFAMSSRASARVDGGAEPGIESIDRPIAGGEFLDDRARAHQARRDRASRGRTRVPRRATSTTSAMPTGRSPSSTTPDVSGRSPWP